MSQKIISPSEFRVDTISLIKSSLLMSNFVQNVSSAPLNDEWKETKVRSDQIWLIEGLYTSIKLVDCSVNIFALKQLIHWNLRSLRSIQIISCDFYLSDSSANDSKNRVTNSRMLEEIDFVYYIQTFRFYDIEQISFQLREKQNQFSDIERGLKVLIPTKFQPFQMLKQNGNPISSILPQGTLPLEENKDRLVDESPRVWTKRELMQTKMGIIKYLIIYYIILSEEFACEEECPFLNFEQYERSQTMKKLDDNYQEQLCQNLIWGNIKEDKRMEERLDENRLDEIKQNLHFYKTYTKYAKMDTILLILGDVLYHNVSAQQLYNLIQQNQTQISSIIFKDTGKIPSKIFSDLMNQLVRLEHISEIAFLQSVVEEENFEDLMYLIGSKRVHFLVIYKSYFRQKEIDALLRMNSSKKAPQIEKVTINHNRYSIIDLLSKKKYEFTPFAFMSVAKKEKVAKIEDSVFDDNASDNLVEDDDDEDRYAMMIDVERLYVLQQSYPKQIYNRIVFYQGKNLSIVSKNVSDRILFKYWKLVKKVSEVQESEKKEGEEEEEEDDDDDEERELKIKQEKLIQILERQLKQDDINLVNCGLVRKMIEMIQEEQLHDEYLRKFCGSKSYKILSARYPISVIKSIRFETKYHVTTAVAYLMGFTRIPEQSLYFYINNRELHESLCQDRRSFANLVTEESSLVIKEQIRIGLDKSAINTLSESIEFKKLATLNLDGIKENQNFKHLNDVLKICVNLKVLSMKDCLLNEFKISQINFNLISSEITTFDISKNRDIDDFSFLTTFLKKACFLKKLILSDMQINKSRLNDIKIGKLCKSLQFVDLSHNSLQDCLDFLNEFFKEAESLQHINLAQSQFDSSRIGQIIFPQNTEHIDLSSNTEAEVVNIFSSLILLNLPHLLSVEIKEVPFSKQGESLSSNQNSKNSQNSQLSKIQKLVLHRNSIQAANELNFILRECHPLENLKLSYQNIDEVQMSLVDLEMHYQTLIKIDLSNNYFFKKCSGFLNPIFTKSVNLQEFKMRFCGLNDERLQGVTFSHISSNLELFDFGGNYEITNWTFLNDLFAKCQVLKILHLDQLKLNNVKLAKVDFSLTSIFLEELYLNQNEGISKLDFLNEVFKKATSLIKLDLSGINLSKTNFDKISFDLLPKHIQLFKVDEDSSNKTSFTDWITKKLNRYLNIHRFQKHHANVDSQQYLNYFGVCEAFNLTQYQLSNEEIRYKPSQPKQPLPIAQLDAIPIPTLGNRRPSKQLASPQNINLDSKEKTILLLNDKQVSQGKKLDIVFPDKVLQAATPASKAGSRRGSVFDQKKDQEEKYRFEGEQIDFESTVNVFYFYSIFKNLEQMIGEPKDSEKWKQFFQHIIENQNVYVDTKYQLLQCINDSSALESEDLNQVSEENLYNKIKILDLSDKKQYQEVFVKIVLTKCHNLEVIKLQNMHTQLKNFLISSKFEFIELKNLSKIDISRNTGNISEFVNNLFKVCPNIQELNMNQMDLKVAALPVFSHMSHSLQKLDLSKNKSIENLGFLNLIFQKCQTLKVLKLQEIGMTDQKIAKVDFSCISPELQDLDISDNNELSSFNFLNTIFSQCKKLTHLNLSNLNLDHLKNKTINYQNISPLLKVISFSKNTLVFYMDFLSTILHAAPQLEELDLSNQIHRNLYESQHIIAPANNIKILNISGNIIHNSFQYAPEIILKSKKFKKLIVNNFNLQKSRLKSLLATSAEFIEELDISNNDTISDLSSLNLLNSRNKFFALIAHNTCLNNYLLNQLDLKIIFKNLQILDLSGSISILDYSFFNKFFLAASSLLTLNLSNMSSTQQQFDSIKFSTIPSTLEQFDISGNSQISNLSFLNEVFSVTKQSLKNLNISHMDLSQRDLEKVDFSLLSNQIETIDLLGNPSLTKIKFLSSLLNAPDSKLVKIKIDKYQIDETSPGGDDEWSQGFLKILQPFLQELLKRQSEEQNLENLLHFFFLLMNNNCLDLQEKTEKIMIFSPNSMFQIPKQILIKDETDIMFDSYNLTFFGLNMLRQNQTKYIFGYEKFYFRKFGQFYMQNFSRNKKQEGDITFISRLNQLLISKNANQAFLPIQLRLTEKTLRQSKMNEFDILYLVNRTPPATMQSRGFSIQFVKSWYAINFYAPLTCSTSIQVDFELLENTSLGNFLNLKAYKWLVRGYRSPELIQKIKYQLGRIGMTIFSVFVTQPIQFRFDHSVILLEKRLEQNKSRLRYLLLSLLFPIYQFICLFGIIFFGYFNSQGCDDGTTWEAYTLYGVYGLSTFIIEAELFVLTLKYIRHLIPAFKPDCQTTFPNNIINAVKQKVIDISWINQWYVNYSISFAQSQLARFDYFTDISFLYSLYSCNENILFWISLVCLSVQIFFSIVSYFWTFLGSQTYERLVTARIDKLCQMCQLLFFQAVSDLLNVVSPSNSITFRKKMVNQKIVSSFIQILFENIPQIVIQIIFLIKKNIFTYSVLFSIISSILMLIINLYKFLTIIPSRLAQEDFTALNAKKRSKVLPKYQTELRNFETSLLRLSIVDQLKCIKSTVYYSKVLKEIQPPLSLQLFQDQIQIAKDLRKFSHNINLIKEFFGNSIFVDTNTYSNAELGIDDDKRIKIFNHPPPSKFQPTLRTNLVMSREENSNVDNDKKKAQLLIDGDNLSSNSNFIEQLKKQDSFARKDSTSVINRINKDTHSIIPLEIKVNPSAINIQGDGSTSMIAPQQRQ